ncbi:hypothetical protein E2562_032522 [Oryza meyeriana var. granulata]|uniref:Uncharacterized protein n=1 Tax=Oryza meyeriana var. granulata TaxID=110450 RepID=A0A6G1DQZ3_9ORYZ|nr:hypothetical protein E2562_032522 [Oryza meyeriana var. granulata]
MCKSKSDVLLVSSIASQSRRSFSTATAAAATTTTSSSSSSFRPGPASSSLSASTASAASSTSLATARTFLSDPPVLYPFQELSSSTNNFLAMRALAFAYWACTLRGRHSALFQLRSPRLRPPDLKPLLTSTARYHHTSIAPLLGACLASPYLYLAYELLG